MGFVSALVDECRYVRNERGDQRVYGEPVQNPEPVKGPWIRCRLDDMGGASRSNADDDSRQRFRKAPSILINLKDTRGRLIDLQPGETIEVRSSLGDTVYMLDGGLRTIRKRRALHHYEATLVRVTDSPADTGDVL